MKEKKRYNWLILFALGIVVLDQATKLLVVKNLPLGAHVSVIPGVVGLTYQRNSGAAWSMLAGADWARWMFLALVVVFLALLVLVIRKGILRQPAELWCMAAVAGGAVGNAIDRAVSGEVVDMIQTEFIDFPVFNVADSFITCGAIALIVYLLFFSRKAEKLPETEKAEKDNADQK